MAEIAIGMDIGASSVKINVLEKLGIRKILGIYTSSAIFVEDKRTEEPLRGVNYLSAKGLKFP